MANIELNKYGTNNAIKAHVLPDDKMRKLGFKESASNSLCSREHWYFFKDYDDIDISFNITISKDGEDVRIDVIDEMFLQPYDYQHILNMEPEHKIAKLVQERVETEMQYLQEVGLLSGHQYGDYI